MQHQLGDGGNLENTGILAVLQRGASKVAAMINSDTGTSTTANFCSPSRGSDPCASGSAITTQFAMLFGYCKKGSSSTFSTHNQVFAQKDFWPIACQLQRLKIQGLAQVAYGRLQLQANSWWGIQGGRTVEMIFSLLDEATAFEAQLPPDTRQAMRSGPAGGFANFPCYKTMFNNLNDLTQLTARQITLLAAQTDWAIMQNRSAFETLYNPPTGFR
mmetsp:Transcript_153968/g.473280  ORF Transcript_153968/g.473280 Transcript_153968/m.473280 type:complete len:216 (+) Transcript_153968:917-1564(+)